jgi:tetratricopeptide (TPR) repeat protein
LDKAFEHVQRLHKEGLGLFLYQDAWERLSPNLRHLLLLMARVSDVLDEYQMQLCCRQANVMRSAAEEALEESRGICTITRNQGRSLIQLNTEFRKFCESRWEVINGVKHPVPDELKAIKSQYNDFIKRSSSEVNDRNEKAYRVPFARAAYNAFMEWLHDYDNGADKKKQQEIVLDYYRHAEEVDSANGWLLDRFAHTLFKFGMLPEAREKASAATQLIPTDPEAWFTRGLIAARLGRGDEARTSLHRAEENGKPAHLCALQKAYSYVLQPEKEMGLARKEIAKAEQFPPNATHKENLIGEIRLFKSRYFG